ncbi:PAQR family membrane homeostasis protein TrhA [Roseisalinus antarcticus]|uniref:Hemolysin-III related n=1 Tax=Roseisalinus antarcticus TaxID=254357 RepID=A0A1Y5TZF5_9RHOB|nr:hemolysin III family protein [Roseisalinus antarcticus]SLN72468.1 hemolysin-III related [Roseisalinus antarcticus]
MSNTPAIPQVSRAERIADGVMHAMGTSLAIIGAVMLIVLVAGQQSGVTVASVSVYGAALIVSFVASACYHMAPWEVARPTLLRIDHAAIFLKIAGTYTPLVALIGTAFGWIVLGVVWTVAVLGAGMRLFLARGPSRFTTAIYLVLGWFSLALIWPLAQKLPVGGTTLIFVGGLLYTAGTVFHNWERLRFQNAIWHAFVLAASTCFFGAIAWGLAVQG